MVAHRRRRRICSGPLAEEPAVERLCFIDLRRRRKHGSHALTPFHCHLARLLRTLDDLHERSRQSVGPAWRDKKASHTMYHQLRIAFEIRGHDWPADRERLTQRTGEAKAGV